MDDSHFMFKIFETMSFLGIKSEMFTDNLTPSETFSKTQPLNNSSV